MKLSRYLTISRPLVWPVLFVSYLLGVGSFSNLNIFGIWELFLFTFPLNFYLYGLNDLYDQGSDKINPYKGNTQGAIIQKNEVKKVSRLVFVPPLLLILSALFIGKAEHLLFVLIFVVFSFLYSHPMVRLKGVPFIDSLTSTIIYLSPALAGYSLHASVFELPLTFLLLIFPPVAIHAVLALRDVDYDKKAGVQTIGVFLGVTRTLVLAAVSFIVPAIIFYGEPVLLSAFLVGAWFSLYLIFTDAKKDIYIRFGYSGGLGMLWILVMVYYIILLNI